MRDVVVDADGEVVLRTLAREIRRTPPLTIAGVNSFDDEPVAPADMRGMVALAVGVRFGKGGDDVQIERLADRARLLRAVEHGDRRDRRRQRLEQMPHRERPEQPHLHDADLLARGSFERSHGLRDGLDAGAHQRR